MEFAVTGGREEMFPEPTEREQAIRDEAYRAIKNAHQWLERVEELRFRHDPPGYIGLDHKLGENVEGCTYCHAAEVLLGLSEPITDE